MIEVEVPGGERLRLSHAIFDLNGTLAVDGVIPPEVAERLARLGERLTCLVASADTHGSLEEACRTLGLESRRVRQGEEKARLLDDLRRQGAKGVVAVGNGRNDVALLRAADLAIAVVGPEGAATPALLAADLVVPSGAAALDLLLMPRRLAAGLRP